MATNWCHIPDPSLEINLAHKETGFVRTPTGSLYSGGGGGGDQAVAAKCFSHQQSNPEPEHPVE